MKKVKLYFILFIVWLTMYSCKTQHPVTEYRDKGLKPINAVKLYNIVEENYLNYSTISIKFDATIKTQDKEFSFDGSLRIKKDSVIWISLRPLLGIELARILITPDSVKFVNRVKSTYLLGSNSYIDSLFKMDIDFFTLQSILLNELFVYPSVKNDVRTIRGYKESVDSNMFCLQSIRENKLNRLYNKERDMSRFVLQDICIDSEIFKVKKIYINDYKYNREFDLKYENTQVIDEKMQKIPMLVNIKIRNGKEKAEALIKYEKITINGDFSIPFTISSKFKPMFQQE